MKHAAIMFLALLSACGLTPQGDLARSVVRDKGAQAYDEGLENAEWFLCSAASVGSIRRKYGRTPGAAAAYKTLCAPSEDVISP